MGCPRWANTQRMRESHWEEDEGLLGRTGAHLCQMQRKMGKKAPWKMSTTHLVFLSSKWIECLLWWYSAVRSVVYSDIHKNLFESLTRCGERVTKGAWHGMRFCNWLSLCRSDINFKGLFFFRSLVLGFIPNTALTYLLSEWMSEWNVQSNGVKRDLPCRVAQHLLPEFSCRPRDQEDMCKRARNFPQWHNNPKLGFYLPHPHFYLYCKTHYSTV